MLHGYARQGRGIGYFLATSGLLVDTFAYENLLRRVARILYDVLLYVT